MIRKTFRILLAVLAVFAFSAVGEAAAPKHTVRHRPRHSSRVATGSPKVKKKVAKKAKRSARKTSAAARPKASTKPK
ncbi:MAG: hypothetical protein ABJA98_07630 [Acidobacteriota bacterium]